MAPLNPTKGIVGAFARLLVLSMLCGDKLFGDTVAGDWLVELAGLLRGVNVTELSILESSLSLFAASESSISFFAVLESSVSFFVPSDCSLPFVNGSSFAALDELLELSAFFATSNPAAAANLASFSYQTHQRLVKQALNHIKGYLL